MKYRHTETELKTAVAASSSLRQTMLTLGMVAEGGNYRTIRKRITALNIDTSHFTGKGWSRGRTLPRRRDLEAYLANLFPIQSSQLRKRLIEEEYKTARCEMCNRKTWLGQPIPLELDHMDGNHTNNAFNNLRIICPNCHAFTPNYRGRNKQRST